MADENKGLYEKYRIERTDGEPLSNEFRFVLSPESDPAAYAALKKYAEITENEQLSKELLCQIDYMELIGIEKPPKCDYCEEEAKVKGTPFLADAGARMCKPCWDMTRKEYKDSQDEEIGAFNKEGQDE